MNPYKIVSLFSGAGGFDWGFHLTGKFTTVCANEIKPVPVKTLAKNQDLRIVEVPAFPSANEGRIAIQGDVAKISYAKAGDIHPDILIGGPPCQDFSIVKGGHNRGIKVKRGKLYSHFIRALVALQPPVFVFENVPGLMSHDGGQSYKMILEDFENLNVRWREIQKAALMDNGYGSKENISYEILFNEVVAAQKLGVPQTRRRLIIIGLRNDLALRLGQFSLEGAKKRLRNHLRGADGLMNKYPLSILEALTGRTLFDLKNEYKGIMEEYAGIWNEVQTIHASIWKSEVWDNLTFDPIQDYLRFNKINESNGKEMEDAMIEHEAILKRLGFLGKSIEGQLFDDGTNTVQVESDAILERMKRIPPGENHVFVNDTPWSVSGRGMSLIYRRPFPLKPAGTVVAFGGGGTWGYHYARNRGKLTNRERARVQMFTDDFKFVGTQSEIRAQIGEAVPPLLSMKIAEGLLDIFSMIQ